MKKLNNFEIQRMPVADRLWERVSPEPNTGCWLWTGSMAGAGYGHLRVNGQLWYAHRLSYVTHRGPIPEGTELDHLCRTRCCINPAHLEAVSHRENWRRSRAPNAIGYTVAACRRGHPRSKENTGQSGGNNYCRVCHRQNVAAAYAKQKLAAEQSL